MNVRSAIALTLFSAAIVLATSFANAAECRLETLRVPCPGHEKEAFDPYNSKESTEEIFQTKSQDLCLQKARTAVKIVRGGTLAKKTITVHYNGQKLEQNFTDTGKCR